MDDIAKAVFDSCNGQPLRDIQIKLADKYSKPAISEALHELVKVQLVSDKKILRTIEGKLQQIWGKVRSFLNSLLDIVPEPSELAAFKKVLVISRMTRDKYIADTLTTLKKRSSNATVSHLALSGVDGFLRDLKSLLRLLRCRYDAVVGVLSTSQISNTYVALFVSLLRGQKMLMSFWNSHPLMLSPKRYLFDLISVRIIISGFMRMANSIHRPVAKKDNILVVVAGGAGDVILSTPTLKALRRAYPQSHISLLVRYEYHVEMMQYCPYINEVISLPAANRFFGLRIGQIFHLVHQLRKRHFQLAVILWDAMGICSVSGSLLTYWAGIPTRIGCEEPLFTDFLTRRLPMFKEGHAKEHFLRIAEVAGAVTEGDKMEMWTSPQQEAFAEAFLREYGVKQGEGFIGIHPTASSYNKRWPLNRFACLADLLASYTSMKVFILGSGNLNDDVLVAWEIACLSKQKHIVAAGELGIGEFIALLRRCSLLICLDSMAFHISQAIGTPSLAIWSVSDPTRYGPDSEDYQHRIIVKPAACRPCYEFCIKPHPVCIENITVDSVFTAAIELLEDTSPSKIK